MKKSGNEKNTKFCMKDIWYQKILVSDSVLKKMVLETSFVNGFVQILGIVTHCSPPETTAGDSEPLPI